MIEEVLLAELKQPKPEDLGYQLQLARQAKELTQQDVSNTLRLSLKQITDLENSDFSALPEPMVTRGFIRNYARLLGLDAEPLLAAYRAQVPDRLPDSIVTQSSIRYEMPVRQARPSFKYVLIALVLISAALVWHFNTPQTTKVLPEKQSVTGLNQNLPTTLPEVALPLAERKVDASAGTEIALPPMGNSTPAIAQQSPVVEDKSISKPEDARKPEPKSSSLVAKTVSVTCTEATWIQVKDKMGKVVFEKKIPAGASESFEGDAPLRVLIGNAKATQITFAGKPVDLVAVTEKNVARLILE